MFIARKLGELSRRRFLLGVLTAFLISACRSRVSQMSDSPSADDECQIVQHEFGEACVPFRPQRIVAINEYFLEMLVAFDIQPLAAGEPNLTSSRAPHLIGKIENVESLGKAQQLNLEKMVQLNPDLILGLNISSENHQTYSQIAPTLSLEHIQTAWKEDLRRYAEILDKSQKSEQLLAQYQARVEAFQQTMGDRLNKTKVSVVRAEADGDIGFRDSASFPGSVLEDIGLPRPVSQQSDKVTQHVSLERLDLLDGDVIFVAIDPGAEDSFKGFQNRPLWQTLNAVKNGRVYVVDSGYWLFGNILAANAILDDLFKYLVEDWEPA